MRVCLSYGGLLLVGLATCQTVVGEDTFGAGRKMQGSTRYSSTSSPANTATPVQPTVAPFSPSTPAASQDSNSNTTKHAEAVNNKVQEIFPAAGASPSTSTVRTVSNEDSSAPSSSRSSGLKSLQQRFSVMRKLSGSKPAEEAAPRQRETPLVVAPSSPTPTNQPSPAPNPTFGPNVGSPVPPTMPDIRMAQRTSSSPTTATVMKTTNSTAPSQGNNNPTATFSESPRGTATVGGPLTSSRRMPTGQATALPRDDQPTVATKPTPAETETSDTASPPSVVTSPIRAATTSRPNNVLFTRQSPLLGVETTGPRSITIGKEATYTVTLANSGDAAAQDVKVSVRIPPWTEVVGATSTSGSAQTATDATGEPLTWNVPRLEAKSKEQLSLRLVPRESRPFDLAVQWTFSPVVSQAMVEVKEPKLAMSVAGPEEILYGETKIYKLLLSNPGTGDEENVVLFLSPIDGGTGSPTRHEIGSIAAGQNKLVEVELTARQAGTLAIKGTATADGNLKSETSQEILVRRASLKLVTQGPELKFAGTMASFNITVNNPGNAAAEGIQVAALLPAGAKYVSSTGGQFIEEQNKVVWTMPSLRSGGEQDFEIKCILNSPGSNRLQVVALAASDLSDTTAINTNVEALADLKLEVSDPTGPVAVGEDMLYEVRIRNRGTKAAENVAVAGFFSGGIEPMTVQGAQHEISPGQVIFKPIASIAPGAEVALKIKARAEQAGNHIFRAEVTCAAVGMKLAAEETTLFYGEMGGRSARIATKPSAAAPAPLQPAPESSDNPEKIVR